jgi:hypothetical protein
MCDLATPTIKLIASNNFFSTFAIDELITGSSKLPPRVCFFPFGCRVLALDTLSSFFRSVGVNSLHDQFSCLMTHMYAHISMTGP